MHPYPRVMKACADCVPCLMKRILFQSRLISDPNELRTMKAALETYSDGFGPDACSAEIATKVHSAAYSSMECEDPYRDMKAEADRVAELFAPAAEKFVESSDDRFAAAVRVSIIGNIMDFGSGIAIDSPDEFASVFESLLSQGVDSDETAELRRIVDSSDTVLYAFDNCGEVIFDRILLRELKSMGKRVVCVVRGKPILNDVSMEDALRVGIDGECDRIVTTGAFSVGFPREVSDAGLYEELSRAGIMIAKGMANYESLSEFDYGVPVAFLLRAKCIPVAKSLGVSVNSNVVRIMRRGSDTVFNGTGE